MHIQSTFFLLKEGVNVERACKVPTSKRDRDGGSGTVTLVDPSLTYAAAATAAEVVVAAL